MPRLRKGIGIFLEIWGGVRLVVDLLESIEATKSYSHAAYLQIVSTPSSRTLTVSVIVVGLALLLYEPLKSWWQTKPKEEKPQANVAQVLGSGRHGVNVELTPSEGQSERMLLAVTNRGLKQMFHAQCRILDVHNDPNPPRRVILDLKWEYEIRQLSIIPGESRNLLVAAAGYDVISGMEWMRIMGISERPWSRWPRGEKANRPEYDLEITVFGDHAETPYSEQFILRPGRHTALEMVRAVSRPASPPAETSSDLAVRDRHEQSSRSQEALFRPIDVSLNCYSETLPIVVPVGEIARVMGLNEAFSKARPDVTFYEVPNTGSSPLLWPELLQVQEAKQKYGITEAFAWRCEVQNNSDSNVVKLNIPLQVTYSSRNETPYQAIVRVDTVPRGKPFLFYVVNDCPAAVRFLLPSKGTAKLIGEQSIREFEFTSRAEQSFTLDSNHSNWLQKTCE